MAIAKPEKRLSPAEKEVSVEAIYQLLGINPQFTKIDTFIQIELTKKKTAKVNYQIVV